MNAIVLKELPKDFLFPFTQTRSVLDIRIGITTLREKWECFSGASVEFSVNDNAIPVNIIPSYELAQSIIKGESDYSNAQKLEFPWQIFQLTDMAIRNDFELLTKNKTSEKLSATN